MSIIDSNGDIIHFPDTMYVVLYLNSLKNTNSIYYHDCFIEMKQFFDEIHIPIYIISNDDLSTIRQIEREYKQAFHYCVDPSLSIYKEKNILKNKVIYGKLHLTIYSRMELVYNNVTVYSAQRFNKNTISNMYLMGLEIKYKNFIKKFKNCVDTRIKLC